MSESRGSTDGVSVMCLRACEGLSLGAFGTCTDDLEEGV